MERRRNRIRLKCASLPYLLHPTMATEISKSLGQQVVVPRQQTNTRASEHWTQPIEAEQRRLTCKEVIRRPLPEGVTVYASGTNRATDIHGAMVAGVPIGVDVSKLSARAIETIEKASLPVLLDSGAFSEVAIRNSEIEVVLPISDDQWMRRLAIYLRVTRAISQTCPEHNSIARVTVVAPDRVGSQELTLTRLARFRTEVRKVHLAGADILVPLQVGQLGLAEFYHATAKVLGIRIVPGMPMKKAVTTAAAILQFVMQTRPKRIHMLGMGITNRNAEPLIRALQQTTPGIHISFDSNRIRAGVGRRRIITRREHHYGNELADGWTGEVDLRPWGGSVHDMTEAIFQPSLWLMGTALHEFTASLTWFTAEQRSGFLADPDGFLTVEENVNDWMYQSLMDEYYTYIRRRTRASARARAVSETLDESKIGGQV